MAARYPVARMTSSKGSSVASSNRTPAGVNSVTPRLRRIVPAANRVDEMETDQRHVGASRLRWRREDRRAAREHRGARDRGGDGLLHMPWEAADGDGQVLNRHPEQVPRHHARTGSHGDGDLCTCRRQLRRDLASRIPGADDEDATPHVPIGPPVFDAVENAAGKARAAWDRRRERVRYDPRCHHDYRPRQARRPLSFEHASGHLLARWFRRAAPVRMGRLNRRAYSCRYWRKSWREGNRRVVRGNDSPGSDDRCFPV